MMIITLATVLPGVTRCYQVLPQCYLVDAKFELELVNIVGEGRNATWKSFGVGQKLPIRSPSDNKYMY